MKTVTFRNPRITAFIPITLLLTEPVLLHLFELCRKMPGINWIFQVGGVINLIFILPLGFLVFPVVNGVYLFTDKSPGKKYNLVYFLVGFLPILVIALLGMLR